jgi:hypothetical protein
MGANADQHEPLILAGFDAVRRPADQAGCDLTCAPPRFPLGPVADENRLAAPEHLDDLPSAIPGPPTRAGGDRQRPDYLRDSGTRDAAPTAATVPVAM